ncbi:MAG: hypothetical protein IKG18_15865 [Atopobiaceae bacterium]|nr:hypothetical protein [Atopobiaceae bacterium]
MLDDPVLQRAENLSYRLSEIVSVEQFDKMRANLLFAREVAYWREWLDTQSANTDRKYELEEAKLHAMASLIRSFAEYRF